MADFSTLCFVCGKTIDPQKHKKNAQINLPVCDECSGTEDEKEAINDLTEGLADGFVCGCI